MKNERKTEIKVGLTVIVSIILLLWIIGWAKNFSFGSERQFIDVSFATISGLEIGDQVTINGVRSGFVEDISVRKTDVLVTLSMDADVELYKDATFKIAMLDLMGGKKVEISPGASEQGINWQNTQKGEFLADIPEVMAFVGALSIELPEIIDQLKLTLHNLNQYLADDTLSMNIKQSTENLALLTQNLNILINRNDENITKLIDNSVNLTSEVNQLIDQNKNTLTESLEAFSTILTDTKSLLEKSNNLFDETLAKENNIGKLLYDDSLYTKFTKVLGSADTLTTIILEQLKKEGLNVKANIDLSL